MGTRRIRPARSGRRAAAIAALLVATLVTSQAPVALSAPNRAIVAAAFTAVRATTPSIHASAASAIVPGSVGRTSIALVATYDAHLGLNYGSRAISASSTMTVTNASGGPIDRLELNTIAARLGRMRLGPLTVDGRRVTPTVRDQTILVPLGGILPAGATATIHLSFKASLRSGLAGSDWLFTRANGIVDLYRWLPWISLARPFTRPNYGDPFYTASSPYVRVRVTADRPLVIASTGARTGGSGLSQTFEARDVRDFTITASPSYTIRTARVGSTTVRLYSRPGFAAASVMAYVKQALSREGALAGTYPYATFSVAQSAGGDGMESPQLIWLPREAAGSHLRWLTFHETAHQWFYGIVGSDQARQPFADEAAADQLARTASGIWRGSRCATARLDLSIYRYSASCYFEVVYVQGSRFLDRIRAGMGSARYWAAIRGYLDSHRFGRGSTTALLEALDAATPADLRPTFAPRFPSLY